MKAQVNAQELRNALRWVSKASNPKSAIPILGCVMLSAEDSKLSVQATDLEVMLTQDVEANVEAEGQLCVESVPLKKYLSKVGKNRDTVLTIDEDAFVTDLGKVRFPVADPEDWPARTDVVYDEALTVNLDEVPLKELAQFMATDDRRPILKSMLFEQRESGLSFCAADGFRLVSYGDTEGDALKEWLVPRTAILRMAELKGMGVVSFGSKGTNGYARLVNDSCTVDALLTEGRFPDYKQIIRDNDDGTWATFSTKEFAHALDVLKAVIEDKYTGVTLKTELGEYTATLTDWGNKAKVEIVTDWDGEYKIAFNADLMLSCLALCGERTEILFNQKPHYPMQIDGKALMVLMPMHIKS